jgi:diguanylate cyclase (GGDEF)-like protein
MWKSLLKNGNWSGEVWDKHKNGDVYPKIMTITAVHNENKEITHFVSVFMDISHSKKSEDEIYRLAFFDPLTQLPNRRLLIDNLKKIVNGNTRNKTYSAMLFIDMDNFKVINDIQGHSIGDKLLIEVSKRLKLCVRDNDIIARLGGDEFVIVLEGLSGDVHQAASKTKLIAEKILVVLSNSYLIDDHDCSSSASIGINLFLDENVDIDDLLKYADIAMYQAKSSGRNAIRFFDPSMQREVEVRAALEKDLRQAIQDNQLLLHYQIQIDIDHRPIGAEALIRWLHPTKGMISPMQFIPVAEESTLIIDIGDWVLETACKQLAVWSKEEKTENLTLAVNVSSKQFKQIDFLSKIESLLSLYKIKRSQLKLELTESVVLNDIKEVVVKMYALKAMGISLSLDDFGTGYSSLSYLKQLPIDQIKIDQSFIRDMISDQNDAVMVRTIIDLAKNFQLNVIAEGVETEHQLEFLKKNGCTAYQGYYFSKPIAIEHFNVLIGQLT